MSAIGILGGMGPQASARLYELLIQGTASFTPAAIDSDFPEIVLLNVPVPNFVSNKKEIEQVKKILIERARLLERAGCTINAIACNTAHILLPDIQAATSVPFLAIPQLVAERTSAAGFTRVGLLATPTTLASTLYDEAFVGIAELVRPDSTFAAEIEQYIYKQLSDDLSEEDSQAFRRQVDEFLDTNRLDAVILGCTELPLVFGPTDRTGILDTLQILADELLKNYFAV